MGNIPGLLCHVLVSRARVDSLYVLLVTCRVRAHSLYTSSLTQTSVHSWEGEGESSNMAVMEIELPSGFTVDEQSIPGLYKYRSVKRVETVEGDTKVIIYFDEVSRSGQIGWHK